MQAEGSNYVDGKRSAEPRQATSQEKQKAAGCRVADSLGCRVVQLVLPGPGEAALHAAVRPQPLDDLGQVVWQQALLFRRSRQGEQLAGIVLAGRQRCG